MKRPRCVVCVGLLALGLGFFGATPAQDDASFNFRIAYRRSELKRIIKELKDVSDELVDDYKKFLKKEDRWEPVGLDRQLLLEIQAFQNELDRFEDHFNEVDDHRALEPEAGDVLRRGARIDLLIYQIRPTHEVTEEWRRIHLGLQQLGQAYALDRHGRRRHAIVPRKEVKKAIAEIENASDEIRDDFKKFLKRDGRHRNGSTLSQLEAELDAFENAADNLADRFNKVKEPGAVEPQVRDLLARGRHIDRLMRHTVLSDEVIRAWVRIRANLDFLAQAYGVKNPASPPEC